MSVQDTDRARVALKRALAAQPRRDGAALTEATEALCRERDNLRRMGPGAGETRRRLKDINSMITLVHAAHYPLSATPWDLLEQALRGLSADEPVEASRDPQLQAATRPP